MPRMNANELRGILDLVEEKAKLYTGNGDGPMRAAALRSQMMNIRMEMKSRGVKYNVMILNLDDRFDVDISDDQLHEYRDANYYGKPYGIWLFDNGTFENYGIGGDENWEFYGNFRREGEPIKLFRNPWTLGLTRHYGSPRRVVFEKRT